jgi:hypothetical protein
MKGAYGLTGKDTTTLSVVGFVFDEPIRPAPAKQAAIEATRGQLSTLVNKVQEDLSSGHDAIHNQAMVGISEGSNGKDVADRDSMDGAYVREVPENAGNQEDCLNIEPERLSNLEEIDQAMVEKAEREEATAVKRRVLGPAVPSAAMLAAAAAIMKDAGSSENDEVSLARAVSRDDDDGEDMLVGPPPPELILETDAAPQDEREAEVRKMIKNQR